MRENERVRWRSGFGIEMMSIGGPKKRVKTENGEGWTGGWVLGLGE